MKDSAILNTILRIFCRERNLLNYDFTVLEKDFSLMYKLFLTEDKLKLLNKKMVPKITLPKALF